jgi:hypothetical protein
MPISKFEIGPVPAEEECESLGPGYRPEKARVECRIFMRQLARQFGDPPPVAGFAITHNPHDFGTYLEVEVRFDTNDRAAVEYAFQVEDESPAEWDDQARLEIAALADMVRRGEPIKDPIHVKWPPWAANGKAHGAAQEAR